MTAEWDALVQVVVNVAAAQGKACDGGGMICECYYTMGQVKHVCVNCEAREVLDKLGIEWE